MIDTSVLLIFKNSFVLSIPLMLASMGGLVSERSGVVNIALEGMMLVTAFITALVGVAFESVILGLTAGFASGIALGLLHALLTQRYRMDHIISGMAINAIALGGTNFLDKKFTDVSRVGDVPSLPLSFYGLMAVLIPILFTIYLRFFRGGLHLLAVGNHPGKSRQMGLRPVRVRFWALIVSGLFCGLAGGMLIANTGRFSDNMTAGRGFIALAAVILGSWRPIPVALACLIFGFFDALQLQLQGTPVFGISMPSQFWLSLPYLVTVIALAGFLGKNRGPAGVGKP